ncbi:MAG: hypothetical protein PGN09_07515 [Sphingomonas fennica]
MNYKTLVDYGNKSFVDVLRQPPPRPCWGATMLMEKITATDDVPQTVADALEDVAFEIADIRRITARMAGMDANSRAYRADEGQLRDLMTRVGYRAGRIEPEALTADGLLAFANAVDRTARRGRPGSKAGTSRALQAEYQATLARETAAIHALSAAQLERDSARRAREAAEEAYQAHGASRLVR